jgi:hypothetical protein
MIRKLIFLKRQGIHLIIILSIALKIQPYSPSVRKLENLLLSKNNLMRIQKISNLGRPCKLVKKKLKKSKRNRELIETKKNILLLLKKPLTKILITNLVSMLKLITKNVRMYSSMSIQLGSKRKKRYKFKKVYFKISGFLRQSK